MDDMTLAGIVTLRTGDHGSRTGRLPRVTNLTVGRGRAKGLEIRQPWVPRELARFEPIESGWILVNGPRPRLRVRGIWIADAEGALFEPGASVLLTDGLWRMTWDELDVVCELTVDVHPQRLGDAETPYLIDTQVEPRQRTIGTDFMVDSVRPSVHQRHQLAVLFEHLINDEPPPANLCATAAPRLGLTTSQVKNFANKYRERVNRVRGQDLATLEQLGVYLVRVTGVLTESDLSP